MLFRYQKRLEMYVIIQCEGDWFLFELLEQV